MSENRAMENPYHPFDPMWDVVEAHLRRQKYKEDMKKLASILESFRKRNWNFIMTVPSYLESAKDE